MQARRSALDRRLLWAASLALLSSLASPVLADGVSADRATPVQREQAQNRFSRGRKLFEKGKHEEALKEFKASHEIVSSPNTRLMIARCLRELDRKVEAYAELGRTAVEARELERSDRRYAQAASSAEDERRTLESELGFVVVIIRNAEPNTTMTVAGEEIKRAAWGEPAPVAPGSTEVLVETPGRPPVRKTVVLAAGERSELPIDVGTPPPPPPEAPPPPPPPTHPSSLRPWAYVAGGVGVAGMATFTVVGIMANASYSDLESACGSGPCPADRQDDVDAGRQQQTIANIGLAVGLVGIGAGVVLYLSSEPTEPAPGPTTALVISPSWVGVQGTL